MPLALALQLRLLLSLFLVSLAPPCAASNDAALLVRAKQTHLSDPYARLANWDSTASPCNWTGVAYDASGTSVVSVDLTGFGVSGGFPSALCAIPTLTSLSLSENNLNGTIGRQSIAACSRLRHLNLSSNCFVGPLPDFSPGFLSLLRLDLSLNNFSGRIPAELGRSLPSLRVLSLFGNLLTGSIPAALSNLSSLTDFNLGYNPFTPSPIPAEIGNLTNLERIWLPFAGLVGEIPPSIARLTKLRNLDLSDNSLTGAIPDGVGLMKSLIQLELYRNRLTGSGSRR